MVLRIPARNVADDQQMESVTNASSREEQVTRIGGSFSLPGTTGTITTGTGVVAATNIAHAGKVQVMVFGTHAGIGLVFEGLMITGGNTTWVAVPGMRHDTGQPEFSSGILPANAVETWIFDVSGFDQFRVRATSYTSGTMNVIVEPMVPWGEPVVSAIINPPRAQMIASYVERVVGASVEAMLLMNTRTGPNVPAAAAAPIVITAGRGFRLTSLVLTYLVVSATTPPWISVRLRHNPAGNTIATTNHLADAWQIGPIAAVVGLYTQLVVPIPEGGFDFPPQPTAQAVGFSMLAAATTPGNGNVSVTMVGYEY